MTCRENRQTNTFSIGQFGLIAICVAGTLLVLGWLLKYSDYGFDFTDESYYIIWMSNPFIYDGSASQFGFIYHPLYKLLGGDISYLRQANILITFGLAWILVWNFLVSLATDIKESRVILLTVAAGISTSALLLFTLWLPTPSYNSLALQALLISATGLVLAERVAHTKSTSGWLLIGVGIWLAFMAKPTTAAALAGGAFIYLLFTRKFSIRFSFISLATALLLTTGSAILIDGSIGRFGDRLQLGYEYTKNLGAGHSLIQSLRIDAFQLDKKLMLAILFVIGTLVIAIWSAWTMNKKWSFIGPLLSTSFFTITVLLTLGKIQGATGFGSFQNLLIFGLVISMVLAVLILGGLNALSSIKASQWSTACLFFAMPHFYAFGTGNNYWIAGGWAAIFWLLAGITLIIPLIHQRNSWMLALPVAIATQAVTAVLLQTGLEQPYRQSQPLRLNVSTLEIGPQRSSLVISEDSSEYIKSAVAAAKKAGFQPTTPMIDLSGESPGILFALEAKIIGQPWTLGGSPGSLLFNESALGYFSCQEISKAWLLFEPNGPRSIPTELMQNLGADFPDDYQQVGGWQTAKGAAQELYKPVTPSETLVTCKALRDE